ncbi:MFS transporter [Aquabacterium sp. OR-4]|uniref:MFS transporter n=1 Tax=Aquabacterium sp. OR-4 TaxID=2978127 RepID=UPI0021B1970A|nr:MFS transporter [Aquabacterium sp. OR-4]MDT7836940.1 MFS transporter [Aquabacterium sp. OR-4]
MSVVESSRHAAPSTAARGTPNEFLREQGWRVVLAAWFGMALSLTALPFYSLGVFAKPLALEFGWSRSVIQSGITFSTLAVICSAWGTGWLIDRFGVRRVALASQAGLALGFVAMALQQGKPLWWQANWFLLALLGVGTTPLTWSRGIGGWFDKQRGLAIGVALSGTGATALIAPPLLNALVAAQGWRMGYLAIATTIIVLGMPTVWLLFRDPPDAARTGAAGAARAHAQGQGLSLGQALHTRHFWIMLVSFAAISAAVAGMIPNLVPMLTDSGLSMAEAASYASLLGLNVILGRLLAGWLLDRFWGPAVALALLMPPALACWLLANQSAPALAVMLIGLAGGAEFDLIAYLCLRYFGTRQYGQIYAWQWAGFSLATGLGPMAFGLSFDHTGSYHLALGVAGGLLLAGPLLLFAMGRYPTSWPQAARQAR